MGRAAARKNILTEEELERRAARVAAGHYVEKTLEELMEMERKVIERKAMDSRHRLTEEEELVRCAADMDAGLGEVRELIED